MVAENLEDKLRLGTVRNLQFWGIGDTAIKYNGVISESTKDGDYAIELSWKQQGLK